MTERETVRQTEKDRRQTKLDRDTEGQTKRQRDKNKKRERETEKDRKQMASDNRGGTEIQKDRQKDKKKVRQRDRQPERQCIVTGRDIRRQGDITTKIHRDRENRQTDRIFILENPITERHVMFSLDV